MRAPAPIRISLHKDFRFLKVRILRVIKFHIKVTGGSPGKTVRIEEDSNERPQMSTKNLRNRCADRTALHKEMLMENW